MEQRYGIEFGSSAYWLIQAPRLPVKQERRKPKRKGREINVIDMLS
jgi:hypothetical protein